VAAAPGDAMSQASAPDDDEGEGAGDEAEQAETNADGSPISADAAGEAERRRRRRGRRGGRRNRRGRDGEAPYAGADGAQEAAEPDVAAAVADLDGASFAEQPAQRYEPPAPTHEAHEQTSFPSAAEPVAVREHATAEMPAEQPRRRSTVREPAPMFSSGSMSDMQPSPVPEAPAPAPAPEPVAIMPEPEVAPAAEAEAKPRRFGWWNKRG
jgi:ribonuclease E